MGNNAKLVMSVISLIVFLIVFALANPVVIIDTGHRGIRVRFGQVIGDPLEEGMHFRTPFVDHVVELNTRTLRGDEQTITYTKDVQQANISSVVNYNLKRADAGKVFKEVGVNWGTIILNPALNGVVKESIGKWNAVELVENRERAAGEILQRLKDELDPRGITVTNFEIVDLKFNKEFEDAVEKKVTAVQRAEEAKNKTVQVQEEANQKVVAAKAEAESMRIRTDALSKSPALVQYEAVQKWDGMLPVQLLGNSPIPFINIGTHQ